MAKPEAKTAHRGQATPYRTHTHMICTQAIGKPTKPNWTCWCDVREGRFLEQEEDWRVTDGEEGVSTRGSEESRAAAAGGNTMWLWVGELETAFKGEETGAVLRCKRRRREATILSGK